ncbi:SRPBCC family protein [Gordonia humi]|uniref:Polyketide cyclase n=1 Tax=Gordonia humi TaxID=686429 RepID=A0A840FE69_9ACTN|nr:SRPBCC family protein [Gordonia humi]MBB4137737.1 hypothetical protein [Gordonia humi]
MTDERIEVTRDVPAPPAEIFDVLRRPYGHIAIDASGMLQSATGDAVAQVGDSFVVHMDRESLGDVDLGKYDVEVKITAYAPDREIAWTIFGTIEPPIGHVYGYRLDPIANGTRVTSYYDWSDAHPKWKPIFPVISESSLKATLGILERAVRLGYPDPTRG